MFIFFAKTRTQNQGRLGCRRIFPRHFLRRIITLTVPTLVALFSQTLDAAPAKSEASDRPNIILILADDQGYGDVGFNGPYDIPTPHLDALAQSGVVMESGYASHPYCSPSRAGLLSGRYQQRFGHECNPGASEDDAASGLPLSETLLPKVLRSAGYRTAAIGKWHLGDAKQFWPTHRGFDEWFGFTGGGLSYWGTPKKGRPLSGVIKNGQSVDPASLSYLTDDFSAAAIDFIRRHEASPFFLYLAYNAPHAPDHATAEHLAKVDHIEYGGRAVYGAMVAGMDSGIGRVMQTLDELNLASQNPALVKRLTKAIQDWDSENQTPLWLDPHGENVAKEEAARQSIVEQSMPRAKKSSR